MPDASLSIRPMTVGAEVLDPPTEITADISKHLYEAWLQYGILLFRGIDSIQRHLAISRCFGELELHPIVEMRAKEDPLFMTVGGESSRPYVYDESEMKVGTVPWHRDTAYTPNICKGAMLRMLETPPTLGETMFADTARAYDDLPDELKARLEGLEYRSTLRRHPMDQTQPGAIWTTVRFPTEDEYPGASGDSLDLTSGSKSRYPSVVHPAVITHPESGRKCVFLSPKEFDYFLGMDKGESDTLFAELVGHLLQDQYVYKHRWSVDDAIVWDNRRFMHAAVGNRLHDNRRGLRTTLAGEFTVGRLYEPVGAD